MLARGVTCPESGLLADAFSMTYPGRLPETE